MTNWEIDSQTGEPMNASITSKHRLCNYKGRLVRGKPLKPLIERMITCEIEIYFSNYG